MLEMILDKNVIGVAIGVGAVAGTLSKCIANTALKHLVNAAGNMGKSSHPFMRLVKAKFEHACMVSEKVENVEVFVDKYLYEYRVAGMKLHSVRRMEKITAVFCAVMGLTGAFLEYMVNGMSDKALAMGAAGLGAGILLYLFQMTTDENYQLNAVRNYMVDHLENVCLHRYEKTYQKEQQEKEAEMIPEPTPELEVVEEATEIEEVIETAKLEEAEEVKVEELILEVEEKKEPPAKEVLIRQILEEFMA